MVGAATSMPAPIEPYLIAFRRLTPSLNTPEPSSFEVDSAGLELKFSFMSRKARRHVTPDQDKPQNISRVNKSLTGE
jgi:hypothetical protein